MEDNSDLIYQLHQEVALAVVEAVVASVVALEAVASEAVIEVALEEAVSVEATEVAVVDLEAAAEVDSVTTLLDQPIKETLSPSKEVVKSSDPHTLINTQPMLINNICFF
jgi:hypothetical protein